MKLSLRQGGAPGVPPAPLRSLALARVAAWARESLAARAIAIAAGLVLLAGIGSSALAGDAAASNGAPASPVAPAFASPATEASASITAPVNPGPALAAPTPSPAFDAGAGGLVSAGGARASPDDPVSLNVASLEDLRRLPGVGPKRAQAILAVRARLGGRFRQVEDLLKVKGIGRTTLRRLRPLVRLDGPPAPMTLDASAAS